MHKYIAHLDLKMRDGMRKVYLHATPYSIPSQIKEHYYASAHYDKHGATIMKVLKVVEAQNAKVYAASGHIRETKYHGHVGPESGLFDIHGYKKFGLGK